MKPVTVRVKQLPRLIRVTFEESVTGTQQGHQVMLFRALLFELCNFETL
jgi:hypothetical protein